MPSTYDRLILGAGSTAATYLSFFPPQPGEKVGVIGMPDPWSRRGEHRITIEELATLYGNIAGRAPGELRVMLNAFE
jgi:hypothetical protein